MKRTLMALMAAHFCAFQAKASALAYEKRDEPTIKSVADALDKIATAFDEYKKTNDARLDAIKAGKPIAPAHRAAWQKLPVAKLRETLDALPVVNPLPQAARTPSANPQAGENKRMQGDESYRGMRDGLGLKDKAGVR